ncbi:ankyrin repeats (3 copies) domain-containing protein [Penicillium frequentans]|uniref:Ankyrin repeats (3 copies) domain-containing protein n=1 Tax=Penicillium frequentans TaxID=3151616 RepID=A0AAD6D1G2_9EURO|nr:ankyrin repeats (3 copies) domain-containing protein [Penicillium glabrum]
MSSIDSGSKRPVIEAKNKSSGSLFIADGHGDQNVAQGNSHQYNIHDHSDRRNITSGSGVCYFYRYLAATVDSKPVLIVSLVMASTPGIPSIWQAIDEAGTGSSETTRMIMNSP